MTTSLDLDLDSFGPRERGQRPGPELPPQPDWSVLDRLPTREQRAIVKKYEKMIFDAQDALSPRLTKAQKSRLAAEQRNGREQEDIWMCTPFEVSMSMDTEQQTPLRRMTLDECHDFCWKLCAVYMSFPEAREEFHHRVDLFHFLDGRWFRGERTWVFCGSSFARGILLFPGDQDRSEGQGQSQRGIDIPTLITTHRNLCAQVAHRQGTLDPMDAAIHGEEDARRASLKNTIWSHADYHLLPIFRRLFIVIDRIQTTLDEEKFRCDWAEEEARLVFTDDTEEELAIDPIDLEDLSAKYDVQRNGNVFTGKLGTLVTIVLALWAEEESKQTRFDPIIHELQERLKFTLRDEREEFLGRLARID